MENLFMLRIFSVFLMFVLTAIPLAGDDFEDFIQSCSIVASNYNQAVKAPGTRFDTEYIHHLRNMQRLGKSVQQTVNHLQLGKDFIFPKLAADLQRTFQENSKKYVNSVSEKRKNNHKSVSNNKLSENQTANSPDSIFKIIQFDVMELRKMEFTTEEHGSIMLTLETHRSFLEFKRLFKFFKQFQYRARTQGYNDPVFAQIFKQRMLLLRSSAGKITRILRKNSPGTMQKFNLNQEVEHLLSNFNNLAEQNSMNRGRKQVQKKRINGVNTATGLHTDMNYAMRNIQDFINQLDQSNFETDPPIRKNGRADNRKSDDDPADILNQNKEKNDYTKLSRKELHKLLNQRRNKIFRGNTSMDEFDNRSEKLYLTTLSNQQRRLYSSYLKEFQQSGYAAGVAVRSAILKLHTQLRTSREMLTSKEMIQLLRRLDSEIKKQEEKNTDLKFDLRNPRGKNYEQ